MDHVKAEDPQALIKHVPEPAVAGVGSDANCQHWSNLYL